MFKCTIYDMICLIFMCVYWLPICSLRSRKVWLRGREGRKRSRRQWRSPKRQNHASGCVLAVTLRFWSSKSPTPGTWWVGRWSGRGSRVRIVPSRGTGPGVGLVSCASPTLCDCRIAVTQKGLTRETKGGHPNHVLHTLAVTYFI